MLKKVLRLLVRLAVLGSLVLLVRAALKRWIDGPEPVPAGPADGWAAGPGAAVPEAPRVAPPANPEPVPAPERAAVDPGRVTAERPAKPEEPAKAERPVKPEEPVEPERPVKAERSRRPDRPLKAQRRPVAPATAGADGGDGTWVGPDDTGAAPSTHPVKVKLSSGLYREPGAPNYDRTRPDRCYVSAEAAEADGFVRAKR